MEKKFSDLTIKQSRAVTAVFAAADDVQLFLQRALTTTNTGGRGTDPADGPDDKEMRATV